jgi:ADP-heptose:LPS heptosyltransferase
MNTVTRKINVWRGRVMMALTRNVGRSHRNGTRQIESVGEVKRILISRPNHRLGNLLLITPLLQEVSETFPDAKIDLFVKGHLPPLIFKNYSHVDRIIQLPARPFKNLLRYIGGWLALKRKRYDLAINVIPDSSSGRLSVKFANARIKFFGDKGTRAGSDHYVHMAKYPVHVFRESIEQFGFRLHARPIPPMDLRLFKSEIAVGRKRLYEIVMNDKKTICLFTYATDRKLYGESWWNGLLDQLTERYYDYNIIEILPVQNVSQLSFRIPSYYSKNIRDIGSVIANTAVFIGADSGMMHLASSVNTPTVAFFKVTNASAYAPYNKDSVALNTPDHSIDDVVAAIDNILARQDNVSQPATAPVTTNDELIMTT